MFTGNSKPLKVSRKKSVLDHILWFIENYLPNKKYRATRKELSLDNLEVETIKQIKKFASTRSKSLNPNKTNKKISFTAGNWALPYLKFLKRIGLIK